VCTHQRKARLRVIELRICPQHRVVALFARCWEPGMRHRRRSVIEVLLVARNTSRHRDAVVVVGVAIRARPRRYRVRAGQRKVGLEWSNVAGDQPGFVVWHVSQFCEKARACVIRILGLCKIRHVTGSRKAWRPGCSSLCGTARRLLAEMRAPKSAGSQSSSGQTSHSSSYRSSGTARRAPGTLFRPSHVVRVRGGP